MATPTKLYWVDTADRSHSGWITLPRGFLPLPKKFVEIAMNNLKERVQGLQEIKILCTTPNGEEVAIEIEPHNQITNTQIVPVVDVLKLSGESYYIIEIIFARKTL
jgi:hypothetical protein